MVSFVSFVIIRSPLQRAKPSQYSNGYEQVSNVGNNSISETLKHISMDIRITFR